MSEDHSTFEAYACHPSLGGQDSAGRLALDRWRLRFESAAVVLEIPLGRLQLEVEPGEADEAERVVMRDAQQPGWWLYSFELELLQSRVLQQQAHTRTQLRALAQRGEFQRRLKLCGWCLLGCVLLGLGLWVLTGLMVRSMVARVPSQWEKSLGDSLMAEVRQQEIFLNEPKLQAQLNRAVERLTNGLPKTPLGYSFYIVRNPMPNAFALPGGHVVVHSGLFELVERPEELAGVLAHEIAHVSCKHGFRKILSDAGPYLLFRLFSREDGGFLSLLGGSSQLLVRQSFSQDYELEADSVGWGFLVATQIDPRGLSEMLKKLQGQQMRFGGVEAGMGAFSSHPATAKRLERLERKWKQLKDKQAFRPLL